jgi:hypothetical protein
VSLACTSRLKEAGTNDMKPFSLPSNSFATSNAELDDKQLMEHTYLNGLTLPLPDYKLNKLYSYGSDDVFQKKCQGIAPTPEQ